MEFLRNHYEKVILSVVLLVVVVFAYLLIDRIDVEQHKIEDLTKEIVQGKAQLTKEVDLSRLATQLKRVQAAPVPEISGTHNLFNPVRWQRRPDGSVIKVVSGDENLRDFVVTKITPLNYSAVFDGPKGPADALRYYFTFTDEGAPASGQRRPTVRTLSTKVDDKNDIVILREIRGPTNNPTELVVELVKDKERVTVGVGKEKAYRRLVGHEAEAKFDPESKTFKGLRLGSSVQFAGETYKVIAITDTTVTIEAVSTNKRTTKSLAAAP